MRAETGWTRELVEHRLIAAFRLMPSLPVYSRGRQVRLASDQRSPLTDVLEWPALIDDAPGKLYLLAWARCRAMRESFGAYCTEAGWARTTAEVGRRRAAAAIAASLSTDPLVPS